MRKLHLFEQQQGDRDLDRRETADASRRDGDRRVMRAKTQTSCVDTRFDLIAIDHGVQPRSIIADLPVEGGTAAPLHDQALRREGLIGRREEQ